MSDDEDNETDDLRVIRDRRGQRYWICNTTGVGSVGQLLVNPADLEWALEEEAVFNNLMLSTVLKFIVPKLRNYTHLRTYLMDCYLANLRYWIPKTTHVQPGIMHTIWEGMLAEGAKLAMETELMQIDDGTYEFLEHHPEQVVIWLNRWTVADFQPL